MSRRIVMKFSPDQDKESKSFSTLGEAIKSLMCSEWSCIEVDGEFVAGAYSINPDLYPVRMDVWGTTFEASLEIRYLQAKARLNVIRAESWNKHRQALVAYISQSKHGHDDGTSKARELNAWQQVLPQLSLCNQRSYEC